MKSYRCFYIEKNFMYGFTSVCCHSVKLNKTINSCFYLPAMLVLVFSWHPEKKQKPGETPKNQEQVNHDGIGSIQRTVSVM